MQSMKPFNKVPRILIEQNAVPALPNFERQMVELTFEEQILDTSIIMETKNASYLKTISYVEYYNDLGDISCLQVLLPVQLEGTLLNTLYGEAGTHHGISKIMQEIRKNTISNQWRTMTANGQRNVKSASETNALTTHKSQPNSSAYLNGI